MQSKWRSVFYTNWYHKNETAMYHNSGWLGTHLAQIHKPNKYKIISMDIPICRGDLCYCVDVLDALTKDFFARKGNPVEETAELGEVRFKYWYTEVHLN